MSLNKENLPPPTSGLDAVQAISFAEGKEQAFPGKQQPDEFRVFVAKGVHDDILAHAGETTTVELCGVLVGKVRKDSSGPFLLIEHSIRGVETKNEGAQVTFTHQTWEHIHQQMEKKYSGFRIVGWYHTHPGFGIFLSDMDKFIQEYFFNQAFQVAMVVDPISGKEGVFAWKGGGVHPLSRCWVGDQVRELTPGSVGSAYVPGPIGVTPLGGGAPGAGKNEIGCGAGEGGMKPFPTVPVLLLLMAFLLGMMFSNLFLRMYIRQSFLEAARAEMREALSCLAGTLGTQADLEVVLGSLRKAETLLASPTVSLESAEVLAKVRESGMLLANLASATAVREDKVRIFLGRQADRLTTEGDRLSHLTDNVNHLRMVMASAYFLQAKQILASTGKEGGSPEGKRQAGQLLAIAIALFPEIEKQARLECPGLFE
jgi:proteasome lid subunit RPN8/RPN11